jgi:nitroimidazol reductase NimA-like FMN-containing flavoprotein (pyridoxamine 5'-phosphate oxidase superfamily)
MATVDARTWLELLSQADCWAKLGQVTVGRIGVLVDSAPEIYPVNFVVDQNTILFRTAEGSKLRGLDRSPSVCFEADWVDSALKTGWSVLVKGRAVDVTDPSERRRVADLPLRLWAGGMKDHWVRVLPAEVTGRRIHHPSAENVHA